MADRLILIESNTSGTGRHFVAAARALGLEPILFAEDRSRYPYVEEDGVSVIDRDPHDDADALDAKIERLARQARIAGIYTSSEYFLDTAAELAQRRGLPGADPAAVRRCRNKWTQRLGLQAAGVQMPAFALARTTEEALAALDAVPLPAVVKPTQGTGSCGVRLCDTRLDVETHAAALLSQRTNERGMPVPQEVLIEEYVSWPELSAEFFGDTLLGVTRKHVSPAPYFVEVGHDFPVTPTPALQWVTDELRRGLQAIGLGWGPAHVEFRWSGDRYALIEINPRLAGGFIPELVRRAIGVDAIAATIALATGRVPDLQPATRGYASIRFICPPSSGHIAAIRGLEQAAVAGTGIDVQMYRTLRHHHVVRHDFRDRIGHVLAYGMDQRDVCARATRAHAAIEVQLDGDD